MIKQLRNDPKTIQKPKNNLEQLLKMIAPPKGVKGKDAKGSAVSVDEGDELFDCEGEEIETETIEEDISISEEEDEMPQATSQAVANKENTTTVIRAPPKVPSPFRNWLYRAQKTKQSS